VGDGVGTANLAGRTLASLITSAAGSPSAGSPRAGNASGNSDLAGLAWVNHRSRRWPAEPLRWLGVNAGLRVMGSADAAEERSDRPARRAAFMQRLLGH
jgi:hypothetical protein